ncbi:LysR substrate-binding domain-containing protein [Chitinilyticum piscinae]|uniref:LysR family transcriptional regulator n=1 Tax=Chitinilyticum piscinae TaxID=2866724 RepID=A0A8J7K0G5_9NEIS|nr:LysR substrate-binding domain-containing protein [Chitinilyticum piscinae]MBE9607991.1 LysR family transcriptional regulator [Chitinilyticum piscinae]
MNALPPLAALRAFEAVCRLGSVVKAADALSVTHSAISHQLAALEDYLGIALFERQGRRLVPTEDGRYYAMRIRLALGEVGEATRALQARPRPNELRLATLPSFGMHWLMPRLPEFQQQHPQYRVEVRAGIGFDDLANGQVDLALRMGSGQWEDLQAAFLLPDWLVVVGRPDLPDFPAQPQQLPQARLLGTMEKWSSWAAQANLTDWRPEPRLACNDNNLVQQAVLQGQGVALLRLSLVFDDLLAGRLAAVGGLAVPHPLSYWLVWAPRLEGSAKLQEFRHWVSAAAQRSAAQMQAWVSAQSR